MRMKSIKMGMSFIRAGSVVCLLINERHALIPSVCGMLVHKELTYIVIIVDSGVIRWLMSFSFLRKSLVSVIKQVYCAEEVGEWNQHIMKYVL